MVSGEEAIRPPRPRDIETEMRTSYLDYAMSVIVSRALPDVRDGLKPVQRRILFAMDDLGLRSGSSFKKSARIIGEVLGKYHPHGDSPVYEAMVRMAQDFSLRYPLVNGQGNFGSIDADPPAAMRYTEARLSQIAEEMLADLDKQTVDFSPNFDSSLNEPTVLPGRLPNLLVNGAQGIAVGMATSIPPHHLGEIGAAIKLVLANPGAGVDELMEVVHGPDFPSGALLFVGEGRSSLRDIFGTGHGRVTLRAVHHTEETARGGRIQIVFTELPYQVNKAALIEQIANLVRDKRIDGIADLRDESGREGLRVVVELKRDGSLQMMLAHLWKLTPLQTTYAANMVGLIDGRPRTFSLKQAIEAYIDHRREVIRRRSEFDLAKARDRHHVVEGLLRAIDMIDQIIAAIREADSADAAKSRLQQPPFALSERQAQAVLDMQLRRLAALERTKLEEEHRELSETIAYLEGLLADAKKIDAVITEDVDELTERFAGERRSQVIARDAESFSPEDLIDHVETVISYSRGGYIKRMPLDTYRTQHRGGKGIKAMQTRPEDAVRELLVADTHDSLLLFTDRGRVFSLKAHEVEERTREWRGLPIRNLVQVEPEERITAMVAAPQAGPRLPAAGDAGRAGQEDRAQGVRQRAPGRPDRVQPAERRRTGARHDRARRRRRAGRVGRGAGRALPGRFAARGVADERRRACDPAPRRWPPRRPAHDHGGPGAAHRDGQRLRQAHARVRVPLQGARRQGHDRAQGDPGYQGQQGHREAGIAASGGGQRGPRPDLGRGQVHPHHRHLHPGAGSLDEGRHGDEDRRHGRRRRRRRAAERLGRLAAAGDARARPERQPARQAVERRAARGRTQRPVPERRRRHEEASQRALIIRPARGGGRGVRARAPHRSRVHPFNSPAAPGSRSRATSAAA